MDFAWKAIFSVTGDGVSGCACAIPYCLEGNTYRHQPVCWLPASLRKSFSGIALTSLQFSNVRYDKGVFVCTVPEKGKFYEVALDKSGRTLIGVDKHFESIAYNNQEDNFRVKKNGREFVCDKKGVEIKAN